MHFSCTPAATRALTLPELIYLIADSTDAWKPSELLKSAQTSRIWTAPFLRQLWCRHGGLLEICATIGLSIHISSGSTGDTASVLGADIDMKRQRWKRYASWINRIWTTRSDLLHPSLHQHLLEALCKSIRPHCPESLFPSLQTFSTYLSSNADLLSLGDLFQFFPGSLERIQLALESPSASLGAFPLIAHSFPNLKVLGATSMWTSASSESMVLSLATALRGLQSLEYVKLSHDYISGLILWELGQLPFLRKLEYDEVILHTEGTGSMSLNSGNGLLELVRLLECARTHATLFPSLRDLKIFVKPQELDAFVRIFRACRLSTLYITIPILIDQGPSPKEYELMYKCISNFEGLQVLRICHFTADQDTSFDTFDLADSSHSRLDSKSFLWLGKLKKLQEFILYHDLDIKITAEDILAVSANWSLMRRLELESDMANPNCRLEDNPVFDIPLTILPKLLTNMPLLRQLTLPITPSSHCDPFAGEKLPMSRLESLDPGLCWMAKHRVGCIKSEMEYIASMVGPACLQRLESSVEASRIFDFTDHGREVERTADE